MPLRPYCCTNCGFWQRYFSVPPACPVCTDYRHPLPPEGWDFLTQKEAEAQVETVWEEVLPGIFQFSNAPSIGIGPCGYLVLQNGGNVAFEGASVYSEAALDKIRRLGGIHYLSASHAHVYGGLWQLAERFEPEVVIHQDALPMAQAFKVSWPFADEAELAPDVRLIHTGGHTPGHTVLYLPEQRLLFCGDALKFKLDTQPVGRATHISTHKAYDAHIPLSHADVRAYRDVIAPLDIDVVVTPWEVVPEGGKAAALDLFEAQLAGRPFADWHPIRLSKPAPLP